MTRASAPPRVVLADDHPLYRRGLARRLRASGIDVVAEVPNGLQAIRAVDQMAPDVVLMDLGMPVLSGLEATRRLARRGAEVGVLVLSVSADEEDVTAAILQGARGYVLKDEPWEAIVQAIDDVAHGRPRISPRVALALLRYIRYLAEDAQRIAGVHLSQRELNVLDLLAEGNGVHDVADRLMLGVGAVNDLIAAMLVKLQVESRVHQATADDGG